MDLVVGSQQTCLSLARDDGAVETYLAGSPSFPPNQTVMLHTRPFFIQKLRDCKDIFSAASNHCSMLKYGLFNDTFTVNHLINCFVRLRRTDYAHRVLDEMPQPNVVSFTSIMAGYVDTGHPQISVFLLREMFEVSVMPNHFTFATVINACSGLADIKMGKKVHALAEITGFGCNLVVLSSLVDMYGKCNDVDGARRVFDSMGSRNIVSWTAMIVGYAQNARGEDALKIFREFSGLMLESPNHFMLASVINACSSLGRLFYGKVTHGAVIRLGHESNNVVASALVDMYSKCGCVSYSDKVFRRIPNPSVIPYTSMIVGAAKYGLGDLSCKLFKEMTDLGIKPNDVTFLGVLHACSHSGLVKEGIEHLESMYPEYGILPNAKHYTCVVDMLGRSGRLDEAYQLAKSVQLETEEGALLWGSLLSASRLHGRVDIAMEASEWLIDCNQQVARAYVTLSNTFALTGEWENVHNVRSKMKHAGVSKEPGCSWIEIRDSTHVFYSGDVSYERGDEVLSLLKELEKRLKERGYKGGSTGLVFVDVEEDAREEMVSLHSERLALAFGLICIPKGVTVRIMKNLRMCADCHYAFKLISEIVARDFVVRDVNRFHHFKSGSCSCKDFW